MDDEPIYIEPIRLHSRWPGVIPGERGYSNDPATYESDLWEEELDRVLGDDAEIEDVLVEENVDRKIAKVIAWMYRRIPTNDPEWRATLSSLNTAVECVVQERLDKRRRDAVIY